MTRNQKVAIAVAFLAAAVGLFVVLQRSNDDAPADDGTASFELTVPEGGPTSIEQLDASQGQHVVLTITLAEEGELHLHGYDLSAETGPGQPPAVIEFDAVNAGVFELEIEDTGTEIAELSVNP